MLSKALIFSFIFAATSVFGVDAVSAQSQNNVPAEAIEQAQRYAASIGCYSSLEEYRSDLTMAVVLDETNDDDFNLGRYLILTPTDVGCQGGTSTTFFIPVIVDKGYLSSAFSVNPDLSGPSIEFEDVNLSTLTKVEAFQDGLIAVSWADWRDGDAHTSPSKEIKAVFRMDDSGNWNLVN